MAVSGMFLMIFLLQHFTINITSVFSENIFNTFSHFMGTNFLVQFILQPILIFGVVYMLSIPASVFIYKSQQKKNISKISDEDHEDIL